MKGMAAPAGRGRTSAAARAATPHQIATTAGREELVARALDERVPQRMKDRRAEDGGQNAGTEVSRVRS